MAVNIEGATVDGRYYVEAKIQSGFYGATWLSKDLQKRSTKVCLKTFFYEGYAQKELRILKEMASGKFRHDNLCTVLHVSLDKAPVKSDIGKLLTQASYVVFEYCSGTDLFNFLVTGPFEKINRVSSFPEALAQHYFTQALLAVAYLHERGVFHRDIKPENCVLDGNFNLKLTDFGTNKMMTVSSDPAQVLRTATKGIGTDSYRAPEVNGVSGYDPSLADVWSLGVTLFFMVGIEEMVAKVKCLDHYTRQLVAPLGIVFPFPLHCSKLDCYMNTYLVDKAPPNQQFWLEWDDLHRKFSPELLNLFNRMFHLQPPQRITIRELVNHPWISRARPLRPKEVLRQMQERCPSNVSPSRKPSPKVLKTKAVGGVDQASLRTALSASKVPDYLTDSELWAYSETLYRLEETQLKIIETSDIQEFIIDVGFCKKTLRAIVSEPHIDEHRSVLPAQRGWVVTYLSVVGFLPEGSLLYLSLDKLNLSLISAAAMILDGLETAVFRSAVEIKSVEVEMPSEVVASGALPVDTSQFSSSLGFSNDSWLPSSQPEQSLDQLQRPRGILRRFSSDPSMSMDISGAPFIDESSQDSMAWSIQSSQEEFPEDFVTANSGDYSESHRLFSLETTVNTQEAQQYKAAGLFCKLSGLLTSYGLYQVVVDEQLALYCRGSTSSFSARLVLTDLATGAVGISSWCFAGREEWLAILSRVNNDMVPTTQPVT